MYIHGQFINQKGNIITVEILSHGDRTEEKIIGTEAGGIYFQEDPVEITDEMNDTFDHLLRHSCTIRLLCRSFISDFYNKSCRNTVVNVLRDGQIVFAGFIEPLVFSQGYNEEYDEVELNCIDVLSSLQYSRYLNVGTPGVEYTTVKDNAEQKTFLQICSAILTIATESLIISNAAQHPIRLYYDNSKALSSDESGPTSVFSQISISEILFLGDEEDDVWMQDAVLEEIMRYLDLHIVQDGEAFYIYAWETLSSKNASVQWKDLLSENTKASERKSITLRTDIVADTETQINIDEAYNKLVLKDNVTSMKNLISSPLEEDDLTSPFSGKQKYMRMVTSPAEGKTAREAFCKAWEEKPSEWGKAYVTDWYIRVMTNRKWKFYPQSVLGTTGSTSYFPYSGNNEWQNVLPDTIGKGRGTALLKVGSVEKKMDAKDNSISGKLDMETWLVLGVGQAQSSQGITSKGLMERIPCAVYESNAAPGVYSPADDSTTNYLVISGSIALTPTRELSCPSYKESVLYSDSDLHTVAGPDGKEYYSHQFYKAETPFLRPMLNKTIGNGFIPFSGKTLKECQMKGNLWLNKIDVVSKFQVLCCMLVVGDKCLVEKSLGQTFFAGDTPGTGNGTPNDYAWRPYKTREECKSDKEYYSQSFTIGFDPKIDDYIVGTEFSIQNNISVGMNLDAEGMAIPICKADGLQGKVKFTILCPAWSLRASGFGGTEIGASGFVVSMPPWEDDGTYKPRDKEIVLSYVENICIKNFEMKLYCDNDSYESLEDNDIIYASDTDEDFCNVKDDLEFKITSGLTGDEGYALGVKTGLNISTPFNLKTGSQLLDIYDRNTGNTTKPEQHYVSNHYDDCHVPRVAMTQNLEDENGNVGLFNRYRHEAMGKDFWVTGISRNLAEGTAVLKLREI